LLLVYHHTDNPLYIFPLAFTILFTFFHQYIRITVTLSAPYTLP